MEVVAILVGLIQHPSINGTWLVKGGNRVTGKKSLKIPIGEVFRVIERIRWRATEITGTRLLKPSPSNS
jgi:hypothetical protein